jgi:formate hydrogenlyase subunit 6/NADH:ubiquinone oxidoreductase subunit I
MKLPKLRELREAIKSVLSRPYTTRFPFEPHVPPDGFRGKPQFYEDDCVGCLACLEVCPARAIEYVDDKENKLRTLTHHQDLCIYCQQCERACITEKGIKLTKEFDLATDNRKTSITQSRKKLVLCDQCGEVIAPLDHLLWLTRKVGHLLFANPTLMMVRNAQLKLQQDKLAIASPHKRAGHLQVICPNCRREMIVKEQF